MISLSKLALESALSLASNTALSADSTNTVGLQAFSVANITQAIENVATLRANNAALNSRMQFAVDQLQTNTTNIEAANSRIFDVDVAKESAVFARNQVLVQSSTAMLAQANGLSGIALSLLG